MPRDDDEDWPTPADTAPLKRLYRYGRFVLLWHAGKVGRRRVSAEQIEGDHRRRSRRGDASAGRDVSKPKRRRYRRYMLVRSLTGELQFEQESLGAMLDEIFDETIGRSKPRRPRVIRIDQPLNHR
jgi:hypothetical protein